MTLKTLKKLETVQPPRWIFEHRNINLNINLHFTAVFLQTQMVNLNLPENVSPEYKAN